MSEEEFINRIINLISKDYGGVMANELKYIIIRKEKQLDKYKQVIDKIKEWKKQTLFDLNRQYKTFEYWEELFEDLDKILEDLDE